MEKIELDDQLILAVAYKGLGARALKEDLEAAYKNHKLPGLALAISIAGEFETHCRSLFTSKAMSYAAKHGGDLANFEVAGFENKKGKMYLTFSALDDGEAVDG